MPEGALAGPGNSWNPFSELEVRYSASVTLKDTLQITRLDRVLYEAIWTLLDLSPLEEAF